MKNITLIGMPGCGKSTIGVLLAKTLGTDFVDTDLLIQKREEALLQQILDTRGLAAFLRAEESAILSLSCTGAVIATGGSAVYSAAAMSYLLRESTMVYLKLPFSEIMSRLSNITTRGIAIPPGMTMADVYAERIPLYEKYAAVTLDCSGKTAEGTVAALLPLLAAAEKEAEQ